MSLLCRGHHDAGRSVYLAAREGGLVGSAEPSAIVMVPADAAASPALPVPAAPPVAAPPPTYTLSAAERASFIERGYLVLPSLVTAKLVDDAVRAINISLGESLRLGTASDDARAGASARADPAVLGLLYSSPLHGVVNQLLGGRANRPKMAQLPLRFPNAKADLPDEQWHIDGKAPEPPGIPSAIMAQSSGGWLLLRAGMKKWHMSPFNLLVGIALSDQPDDDHGNLAVAPGAHVEDRRDMCRDLAEISRTHLAWRVFAGARSRRASEGGARRRGGRGAGRARATSRRRRHR